MESAEYYKQFLLKIYRCKQPFEVVLRDRVTKRTLGSYVPWNCRINIYIIKLSSDLTGINGAFHHRLSRHSYMNMHIISTTRNIAESDGCMGRSFGVSIRH